MFEKEKEYWIKYISGSGRAMTGKGFVIDESEFMIKIKNDRDELELIPIKQITDVWLAK